MQYKNPAIAPSLNDETHEGKNGKTVYSHDCHNLPICSSYGEHFFACLTGANEGHRCSHADKIKIRILNDMNPNATHKPEKEDSYQLNTYING